MYFACTYTQLNLYLYSAYNRCDCCEIESWKAQELIYMYHPWTDLGFTTDDRRLV